MSLKRSAWLVLQLFIGFFVLFFMATLIIAGYFYFVGGNILIDLPILLTEYKMPLFVWRLLMYSTILIFWPQIRQLLIKHYPALTPPPVLPVALLFVFGELVLVQKLPYYLLTGAL
jgi:hypothetical protein